MNNTRIPRLLRICAAMRGDLVTNRRRITEYLDIDLDSEMWCCNRCSTPLISAHRNYKEGLLLYDRDPREIHRPFGKAERFNYSIDPNWCRIVEFYCPHCGVMMETEYLPPGHPITHDIELDIDALKRKYRQTSS